MNTGLSDVFCVNMAVSLATILLLLYVHAVSNAGTDSDSAARAAAGLWPLNAQYGASDITGHGNNGTATGTQLATGPYGDANGAFLFSGKENSYLDIPNNGRLDVRYSFTILAHIFPTGSAGPIFDYIGNNNWALHLWHVSPQSLFMRPVRRDGYFSPAIVADVLQQNAWNYVGGTYESSTGMAFLWNNGEIVGERHIGVAEVASQYPVRVAVRDGDTRYFSGRIACLQLYNYAMSKEQVGAVRDVCKERCRISSTARVCEHGTLSLRCPTGQHIDIISALYGRQNRDVCNQNGNLHNINCNSTTSLKVVTERCNGRGNCSVTATNGVFGDPCGGTFKYLEVACSCTGRTTGQPTSTSSIKPEMTSNMDKMVISTSSVADIRSLATDTTTTVTSDTVSTHSPPTDLSLDSSVIVSRNVSLTLTAPGSVDLSLLRQRLETRICGDQCRIAVIFHNITDTTPARKKRQADDEVTINVTIQLIVLASQGGTLDRKMAEDLLQEKADNLRRLARSPGGLSINIGGKVVRLVDNSGEGQKTPPWLIGVICAAVVVIIIIALVTVLLCRRKHKPGVNMPGKSGNEMTNLDTSKRRDHPATDGSVDNIIYNTEDEGVVDNVIYNAGDDGTVDNVIYEGQDSQRKDRENAPESQYETVK